MALFGALSTARSGLVNTGAAMAVIGNNISNVGSTGFKGSRAEFADLISAEAGGQIGKIGLGSRIGAVRTLFTQGAIESTGRALDLAIEGQGFFVLGSGEGQVYTRAGNFQLDSAQNITNNIGDILQGTPLASDATPTGGVTDVTLKGLASKASASSEVTLKGNLQSNVDLVTTVPPGTFDGTTFDSAFKSSNFSTSVRVFDSLGQGHDTTVFFTRTASNAWDVNIGIDAGDVGGTSGNLQLVNSGGQITFNSDGTIATAAGLAADFTAANNTQFANAGDQSIAFNLGTANQLDGMSQFASPSGINFVSQNGFGAGGLVSLDVNSSGILSGTFDNGQSRPLFQLQVDHFANEEGLSPAGNGLYRESIDSGPPAPGTAQSGGNGTIVSSALEQSNVQISQEFIELISAQRSFQANARVITASDQLLSDLINIIR